MEKIKKILSGVGVVAFIAVCSLWLFSSKIEHIEDTNGADNYNLQQITDYDIVGNKISALNYKESTSKITNVTTYSSDKFTGVAEIFMKDMVASRFYITVNHAQVNSGNFKMVLVYNDEIVHEFKLNELTQDFILENVKGTVALRIAGESADFKFDYYII